MVLPPSVVLFNHLQQTQIGVQGILCRPCGGGCKVTLKARKSNYVFVVGVTSTVHLQNQIGTFCSVRGHQSSNGTTWLEVPQHVSTHVPMRGQRAASFQANLK